MSEDEEYKLFEIFSRSNCCMVPERNFDETSSEIGAPWRFCPRFENPLNNAIV